MHTNRLSKETSPYLLQHAHNPVDWYPWGEEALNRAKNENKPILVSIGYAACHWCHVMERESFENEETATLMNANFINIKIDREERPDIDHIYMDAVQAMTGSGGWPLNVFLTPEGKPFYGGTYFPPVRAFNRASWKEILHNVSLAFKEKRNEIDAQAENLTAHLVDSNSFGIRPPGEEGFPEADAIEKMTTNVMKNADRIWGGFGNAPKFPQTFTIRFLLQNSLRGTETAKQGLAQALLSLDKMIEGGIYDQVGGGFARYSTDTEWLAPHFEKMLYDNALLVEVLSEAYQLTKNENYLRVIDETMEFIRRELLHEEAGFFSALDADSEGVEGKFYVWDYEEVQTLLKENADIFSSYFDITKEGNWSEPGSHEEHKNILRTKKPLKQFAKENNHDVVQLENILSEGKKILLAEREKRVRPLLDDKILLGWNALMNTACSKAFGATGNHRYKEMAERNMDFIFSRFGNKKDGSFYHTWKNDQAKFPAFLDDYAFLIRALIQLSEAGDSSEYLVRAGSITEYVIEHFADTETDYFFFTNSEQKDLIIRKKEVYDGATPSGNAMMALNLYQLSIIFDKKQWKEKAISMVKGLEKAIIKYPGSFGNWAILLSEMITGTKEIAVVGKDYRKLLEEVLKEYIPGRILMGSEKSDSGFPILAGKDSYERAAVFLCSNYSCQRPVFSVKELMSLINSPQNR